LRRFPHSEISRSEVEEKLLYPEIIENSLHIANILRVKENELYLLKNELSLFEYESKSLAAELINEYDLDIVLVTQSKAGAFALDKEGRYFEDRVMSSIWLTLSDQVLHFQPVLSISIWKIRISNQPFSSEMPAAL